MSRPRKLRGLTKYLAIMGLVACFNLPVFARDDRKDLLDIEGKNFSQSTIINNKWMPLRPGTQLVFEGTAVNDDDKRVQHQIIFTVTDLIKEINGIKTVVIWDRDFSGGRLEESELTFFAQDNDGNVWHLGQYREFYDELELVGSQGWLVGHLEGAKAGIMMKADPKEGTPSYSEGYAPAPFNWTDRGQTRKVGEKVTVPAGTYDNVLLTEEWASDEAKDAIQLKYYAYGVGNIKVHFEGGDRKKEMLELTAINQLSPSEMDSVRAEAMKLDDRNYVYGRTEPARRRDQ